MSRFYRFLLLAAFVLLVSPCISAGGNDNEAGPLQSLSPFDKRVAQLEDAIKEASRDIKSAEELLLSTDGERSREHYRMLIDNYTARRTALEAQLDAFILKGEEAGRAPASVKGKAPAPASSASRRSKRARRKEEDDESDSDEDDIGSDSKMLPRELPHPPDGYKEAKTGKTQVFRTQQFQFMALVFYIAWQLYDTMLESYPDMKKEVPAKRPVPVDEIKSSTSEWTIPRFLRNLLRSTYEEAMVLCLRHRFSADTANMYRGDDVCGPDMTLSPKERARKAMNLTKPAIAKAQQSASNTGGFGRGGGGGGRGGGKRSGRGGGGGRFGGRGFYNSFDPVHMASVMAGILMAQQNNQSGFQPTGGRVIGPCHSCGAFGHLKHNCPNAKKG